MPYRLPEREGATLTIQTRPVLEREDYPSREEGSAERDRLLVEAYRRHDPDAFAIIVDDHWDTLICQARRILGPNGGAAEDVVQETFERALKALPRFGRTGEYKLGAWLNHILRNVIQNHWERSAREARSAERSANERDYEVDVADRVGDPVVARALQRRILGLPETQRAAFVMREVLELPVADVARALNVSEENVRARVSRSKDRLRRSTEGLRSAVGAAIAAPFGLRLFHRGDKSVGRAGDQVALQISSSPVAQTVVSLATSSLPRGSLVFGIAATVATLGTGTALLATSTQSGPRPAARIAPAIGPTVAATPPPAAPLSAPAPALATGSTPSTAAPDQYSWVNAGVGSNSAPVATAGLPAATCAAMPAPSSAGWSGPALGLSNALSAAIGGQVELPTVGSTLSFSSLASVAPFGQQGSGVSALVVTNACVSSSGQWFSATVSGVGGPFQLVGSLVQVLGTDGQTSYIFRGSIPASGNLAEPLAGAIQFVADLTVVEPANTAQLTIVFLGPLVTDPSTGTPASTTQSTPAANPETTAAPTASSTTTVNVPAPTYTLNPNGQGASGFAGPEGSATAAEMSNSIDQALAQLSATNAAGLGQTPSGPVDRTASVLPAGLSAP